MNEARIITLTTDFGDRDGWVGQMKGAALGIAPEIRLVDLCHHVPAHDVAAGSYLLETAYDAFPPDTIHVAVVDPGVGTERQAVAVSTGRYVFVAPDNGLLTRVLDREEDFSAYRLDADHYFRAPVSATFEGRDVFAPAAAWIARGVGLEHMGPAVTDLVRLASPPAPRAGATIVVRVLHADRFGNLAIDVTARAIESACGRPPIEAGIAVEAAGHQIDPIFRTFADAPHGEPFLLVNSAGYLEIAVREARADETLGLVSGCEVEVSLRA